jgi:manganese transport protein
VVIGMLAVIAIGFLVGLVVSPLEWDQALNGVAPRFADSHSVLLAVSMVGATVMPHAIYAHSGLARDRHRLAPAAPAEPWRVRQLLRATRWDVAGALTVAGGVNVAMLLLAAAALPGVAGTDTIPGAAHAISTHLGTGVGVAFGVGLLASGLASTAVGGYAGSAIMTGLLHRNVPLLVRRTITMIPALLLLALGVDPTNALVLSQVVLSLGIPFALVPLAWFTSRPAVMGEFANGRTLRLASATVTTGIVLLNVVLLVLAVKE